MLKYRYVQILVLVLSNFILLIFISNSMAYGPFLDSGQNLGSAFSNDVALGDVDGDADLDAFGTNGGSQNSADNVWVNILSNGGMDSCVSDIDEDGDVDSQDLAIMASEFGSPDCQN